MGIKYCQKQTEQQNEDTQNSLDSRELEHVRNYQINLHLGKMSQGCQL